MSSVYPRACIYIYIYIPVKARRKSGCHGIHGARVSFSRVSLTFVPSLDTELIKFRSFASSQRTRKKEEGALNEAVRGMKHILMSYFACLPPLPATTPIMYVPGVQIRMNAPPLENQFRCGGARAALKVGDRGGDWRCPFGGRWPFRRELISLRGIG